MATAAALAALLCILLFARSYRAGPSGRIGLVLGVVQLPIGIAVLWLLALLVGWWTVLAFIIASVLAGLLIPPPSMAAWVTMQPITGGLALVLCGAGWALHYLR